MPYATVDDIEMRYEVRGRGTPLLMLMGLGGSGDMWGETFLAALDAHFRLIVLDNRGTGGTSRGSAQYTVPRLTADALGVLDAEGILAAHVLGASLGGMAALEMAVSHPARVRGLVLGSTTPGGPDAVLPPRSMLDELERHGPLGSTALLVSREFVARRTGLLTRLAARAVARPTGPAVLRDQTSALLKFDAASRLGEVVAPTLVIAGSHDRLIPPENARLLVHGIRGARGVFVKGAGHCFFWEAPERAARAVVEFLSPLQVVAPLPG
jgi:3-oxoadipate enol-lactonase